MAAALLAAAALAVQSHTRKRTSLLAAGCTRLCLSRQGAHTPLPDFLAEVAAQLPGGAMGELAELVLAGFGIARLPGRHLAALGALTRLDLSRNALAALPPEVGLLSALDDLDVSRNRLRGLPPGAREAVAPAPAQLHGQRAGAAAGRDRRPGLAVSPGLKVRRRVM